MMQELISYLKTYWPNETSHVLRIAEDAVNQTFLFDLPWDMERTYDPVTFSDEIIWDYQPKDDPEFIFQFNRHRYFMCLGEAYQITSDERYAQTLISQLTHWIQHNPITEDTKKTTWRTIEAGIRGENWIKAVQLIKTSPAFTEEFQAIFEKSLVEHAEYLCASDGFFQKKSNWGVLESHGLFEIALYLKTNSKSIAWRDLALQRLEEQSQIQIMDDGVQWEQSPMYHNEVFHCYLEILRLSQIHNITLPESILEGIRKMAYANLAWKKPNHTQPAFGDSDETDLRDILTHAAFLLKDPVLKFAGYSRLDFDGVWDFGYSAIAEYEQLPSQKPDFTSIAMTESGNYILRSDWTEEADYFRFRCGSLGGGHGHSDKLHFDLVLNGEDIFMDSGRYTYVPGEKRSFFKSALSHNVPLIDGKDYLIIPDAWNVKEGTPPMNQIFYQKGIYNYLQGGHPGYFSSSDSAFINRKIIAIGTKLYIIVDQLYAKGQHIFEQMFHFNNQGTISQKDKTVVYHGTRGTTKLSLLSSNAHITLEDTFLSRNYNQMQSNIFAHVTKKETGFQTIITAITDEAWTASKIPVISPADQSVFPDNIAEAIKLEATEKNTEPIYTIIINHKDVANPQEILQAEDKYGVGRIQIYETKNKRTQRTILEW